MKQVLHRIYLWLTGYCLGLACKFIDESMYYNMQCSTRKTYEECCKCIYNSKITDAVYPCRLSQLRESLFSADIHYYLLKKHVADKAYQ
jgi:hypothetical protein